MKKSADQICRIVNFQRLSPTHLVPQKEGLEWQAQRACQHRDPQEHEKIRERFRRFGVAETKIAQRWTEIPDFDTSTPRDEHFFPLDAPPANLQARMNLYKDKVTDAFHRFYQDSTRIPEHLIHVTCTGYVAPSPAQILVNERSWPTQTLNAYHMGCYAAFPALRMAEAFVKEHLGKQVDIVHTELCTLHMNPFSSDPEQIVISTLFGDGYIKYSVCSVENSRGKGFTLLALKERIIKNSAHMMTWVPGANGFEMTLSREVPLTIRDHIRAYVSDLCQDAGISLSHLLKHGLFAIHPGGPKIIELVQKQLELSNEQVASSQKILKEHGNMSSATLPHVWEDLLRTDLEEGTPVLSVAFGPGLTVYGGLFQV